ncbi:MAG: twin-arginine translocation signal domain-containing protein, partial [Verrucomicrobia bacterium]|nr:twin-arginine translocation signal domain-containing protein [Verrucomicrobiota bacterium]
MNARISRRQFMTGLAATAVSSVCLPRMAWAASGSGSTSTIYVVHGSDPGRMLAAG